MKNKILPVVLILIIIFNVVSPCVYALTESYNFTSNEDCNLQIEDEFTYRNDCFTRSSFLGCSHLEILSAQVAEASASWYGEDIDKYEIDYSENAHNIVQMLSKMGFENVSTNKYYALEKQENSAGVAVGHRTIIVGDKNYTLLAIIPRSAGYKQEWAGNFMVGDGDIHEGFKSARDEILRYVKKYIKDNNIQGDLKVWTAGHSRGAAIANMIGAFFAGGGIEYFGDEVSITPEDVYCYTFATPATIKDGLDKNVELSVSANRNEIDYINDTLGNEYNYTKGGKVNAKSEDYNGIRNLISSNDIFTMLPPEIWGFTHYGNDLPVNHDIVTDEAMLQELDEISQFAYNKFINGGDANTFERKTFDLKTLSIIKDNCDYSAMDISTFLKERLKGLTYNAKTNQEYKDKEYQEVLKAMAGTYGMSMTLFDESILEDSDNLIVPLVCSYLSYASKRLQEENIAADELDAVTIVIEELISYFTGEEIDKETFTFDDFITILAKYISDNENEPITDILITGIENLVPQQYQSFLQAFEAFAKKNEQDEVSVKDGLKAFIKACYYGPDEDCLASSSFNEAADVRSTLYAVLYIALGSNYPEITTIVLDANSNMNGKSEFGKFVEMILNIIKTVKDEDGNVIITYSNLSEVADATLEQQIDIIFSRPLEKAEELYESKYKNILNSHINVLKANISKVREMLLYTLLYEDENYSVEKDIKNISTFIGNADIIPLAHYNEIYLAYAKAAKNFDCGYEEHMVNYTCIEGEDQEFNQTNNRQLSFKFNIDYDIFVKEGKVFIDNIEISRDKYTLSKGSTIVTFNEEFTKSLALGKHTIKAGTDEGNVEVEFTISKADNESAENAKDNNSDANVLDKDNNKVESTNNISKKEATKTPKTGDNIIMWIIINVTSLCGILGVMIFRKNKNK